MDKVGRSEIREKLSKLYSRAFTVVGIHQEIEQQKLVKEEYQKLFKEYMAILVDLGTLTLTKIVKFQLPDGTEIKPNARTVYIEGKAFTFERDQDKKIVKARGAVVDHDVGQQVPAEYTIIVVPEVLEPIRNLDKPEKPIIPAPMTSSLPDQSMVDNLMVPWTCFGCTVKNLAKFNICRNCGMSQEDSLKLVNEAIENRDLSKLDKIKGFINKKGQI